MRERTVVRITLDEIGGGKVTLNGEDVPQVCAVEVKGVVGEPTHVILDLIAVDVEIDVTTMADKVRKVMVCPACKARDET